MKVEVHDMSAISSPFYHKTLNDYMISIFFQSGSRNSAKSSETALRIVLQAFQMPIEVVCLRKEAVHTSESNFKEIKETIIRMHLSGFVAKNTKEEILFLNGSRIIRGGLASAESIKSYSNFDIIWIEEADQTEYNDYMECCKTLLRGEEIKTYTNPETGQVHTWRKCIILTTNPDSIAHWIFKEFIECRPDYATKKRYDDTIMYPDGSSRRTVCLFSTIDDNTYANDAQKAELDELEKRDVWLYNKYRKGIWGVRTNGLVWVRGVHYQVVSRSEFDRNKVNFDFDYGMDFGGGENGDPTVINQVHCCHKSKIILWDEKYVTEVVEETQFRKTYKRETTSSILAGMASAKIRKDKFIYADNAWPITIADIAKAGYNIKPCVKNSTVIGSKEQQINSIRASYTIFIPEDAKNLLLEMENASWEYSAKNNTYLNKLKDGFDHLSADAGRYPIMTKIHKDPAMNEHYIKTIRMF